MEMFNSRRLTKIGLVAALYVVITLVSASVSYEAVQFRFSEMLMLLCYYDKDHIMALTIGCFLANLFSPLGMVDMLFGTAATLIAAILIYQLRKHISLITASLIVVFTNAVIIGLEIKSVIGDPFWMNAGFVAIGEFACVTVGGVILFKLRGKNKVFMKLITAGSDKSS